MITKKVLSIPYGTKFTSESGWSNNHNTYFEVPGKPDKLYQTGNSFICIIDKLTKERTVIKSWSTGIYPLDNLVIAGLNDDTVICFGRLYNAPSGKYRLQKASTDSNAVTTVVEGNCSTVVAIPNNVVLAVIDNKIWYSTDIGETWTNTYYSIISEDIAYSSISPDAIYLYSNKVDDWFRCVYRFDLTTHTVTITDAGAVLGDPNRYDEMYMLVLSDGTCLTSRKNTSTNKDTIYRKAPGSTTQFVECEISGNFSQINGNFIELPNGIVLMPGYYGGDYLYYSTDKGAHWSRCTGGFASNGFNGATMLDNNTVLVIPGGQSTLLISTNEYTSEVVAHEKYLDQKGAQEIVTQFKAYCDSLVGGA